MPRMTPAAREVKQLIESGDLDADMRTLRNLCNKRLRQLRYDRNTGPITDYAVGDEVRFVVDPNDYLPNYMEGAVGVIDGLSPNPADGPPRGAFVKIMGFKIKPRGGPGGGSPRFTVGEVGFFTWAQILPLDMEQYKKAHAAIKQRYTGGT